MCGLEIAAAAGGVAWWRRWARRHGGSGNAVRVTVSKMGEKLVRLGMWTTWYRPLYRLGRLLRRAPARVSGALRGTAGRSARPRTAPDTSSTTSPSAPAGGRLGSGAGPAAPTADGGSGDG